jgi:hypothetical protein
MREAANSVFPQRRLRREDPNYALYLIARRAGDFPGTQDRIG